MIYKKRIYEVLYAKIDISLAKERYADAEDRDKGINKVITDAEDRDRGIGKVIVEMITMLRNDSSGFITNEYDLSSEALKELNSCLQKLAKSDRQEWFELFRQLQYMSPESLKHLREISPFRNSSLLIQQKRGPNYYIDLFTDFEEKEIVEVWDFYARD